MQPILVYLAGPYRQKHPVHIEENIANARKWAKKIWALNEVLDIPPEQGIVCYCPHMNSAFFDGLIDDIYWLEGNLEMVRRSNVLFALDNYKSSVGTMKEIWEAKAKSIPLFYQGQWKQFVEYIKERQKRFIKEQKNEKAPVKPFEE